LEMARQETPTTTYCGSYCCCRPCTGGKPAAHPLHRYITYEKRRFSTRYVTVTCRYTGAAQGGGGHANGGCRPCAGGKPALHPLHRYITYENWRFSTRYVTVTCRYTCLAGGKPV
jgi:hypothetical protein